jgi:hypothetical protein
MGLVFRRRIPIDRGAWLNLSKSAVSASKRVGRVTISSTGRGSIRIARGLSFRFGRRGR